MSEKDVPLRLRIIELGKKNSFTKSSWYKETLIQHSTWAPHKECKISCLASPRLRIRAMGLGHELSENFVPLDHLPWDHRDSLGYMVFDPLPTEPTGQPRHTTLVTPSRTKPWTICQPSNPWYVSCNEDCWCFPQAESIHPKKLSKSVQTQTCTNHIKPFQRKCPSTLPHHMFKNMKKTLPFCRSKSLGFHLVSVEISSALLSWAFCCISRKARKCSWRLRIRCTAKKTRLPHIVSFHLVQFSIAHYNTYMCLRHTSLLNCWWLGTQCEWSPVISQRAWECEGRNLDPQGLRLSSYNWLSKCKLHDLLGKSPSLLSQSPL